MCTFAPSERASSAASSTARWAVCDPSVPTTIGSLDITVLLKVWPPPSPHWVIHPEPARLHSGSSFSAALTALPLRLAFFEERLDALLHVLGRERDRQLRAQEVQCVRERHV